jgi:cytochrome c peroxidase
LPFFIGRFKTTLLRNIEYTGPYMHDGRFASLEEVIEHYYDGIQNHPRLSPALTDANDNPIQLNLSDAEKSALLAFLKALSDTSVAEEEKWSNPFL